MLTAALIIVENLLHKLEYIKKWKRQCNAHMFLHAKISFFYYKKELMKLTQLTKWNKKHRLKQT